MTYWYCKEGEQAVDGLNHSVIAGKCSGCVALRAELGVAWKKLAAVSPLLRRLRTAHGDRYGVCKTCCVPWPCMDAVAVDRILKGASDG